MAYLEAQIGETVLVNGRRHRVLARYFSGFVPPYFQLACLDHQCDARLRPVTWHLLAPLPEDSNGPRVTPEPAAAHVLSEEPKALESCQAVPLVAIPSR